MRKGFTVLTVLLIIIAFGIFEIIQVNQSMTYMETNINELYSGYQDNMSNITIYASDVEVLHDKWIKDEVWLCYIFNHRDLSMLTDSLVRLGSFTKNNDFNNAMTELSLLKQYTDKTQNQMGFNIHNIL